MEELLLNLKIVLIFMYIQFHYLKSENEQKVLTLQYANSKQVSQKWDLSDINLRVLTIKSYNF